MKELDEIKARADKATPGPWTSSRDLMTFEVFEDTDEAKRIVYVGNNYDNGYDNVEEHDDAIFERRYQDTEFIAHARTDIPRLVEALERVLAEVKRNTDKAFYEHCSTKTESILRGEADGLKGEK